MMNLTNAEIISNEQISQRYCHMKIAIPDWSVREVKPGQFFHIRTIDAYSPLLRRPFSIYRINEGDIPAVVPWIIDPQRGPIHLVGLAGRPPKA